MTIRIAARATLAALTLTAAAPAHADDHGATCRISAPVSVDVAGVVTQTGDVDASCAGTIGGIDVDPTMVEARLGGSAQRDPGSCFPVLSGGRLALDLRRLVTFDAGHATTFEAEWGAGKYALLNGRGNASGYDSRFVGTAAFLPATSACPDGAAIPGTVRMTLVLEPGTPSSRPAPAADPGRPAAEQARPSRACKHKRTKRARRRCRQRRR